MAVTQMAITHESVRELFKGLENADGSAFFQHVADDVDWTVMGAHPLAGHYLSKKAFIEGTFAKLGQVLPNGAQLHTENVIVEGDQLWSSFIRWRQPGMACDSITATAGWSIFRMD